MNIIAVAILLTQIVGQFRRVLVVFGRGSSGLVGMGHLRQLVHVFRGVQHCGLIAGADRVVVVGTLKYTKKAQWDSSGERCQLTGQLSIVFQISHSRRNE